MLTSDGAGSRIQWRQGNVHVGCALGGSVEYAWDLPPGTVRQRIEPIVESRRLLPLAEAEQDGVLLDVMDETRKTIARLDIAAGRVRAPKPRSSWQPFEPFLTLSALRGYDDQCAGPIAIIESRPGIERIEHALQGHVLRVIGVSVPQDASLYRVDLEPMVRADAGALRMLAELLRIVSANHAGVVAGLDSVFLQDFLVAARRSRTLIEHAGGILPQVEVAHFGSELAWLVRATGPARELDELLRVVRSLSKHLNPEHQQRLVELLDQERACAQGELVAQLTSDRYQQLVDRWMALQRLGSHVTTGEGCGALPLMTIVSQRAWSLYQRLLAGIELVGVDTPLLELNRIRGVAQDLRNLVDTAASIYDENDRAVVLRALGRLQSALDEFNDACTQAEGLRHRCERLRASGGDCAPVRHAVEALAGLVGRRVVELRTPANRQLLRFGESATRAAFERVFQIKHLIELVQ